MKNFEKNKRFQTSYYSFMYYQNMHIVHNFTFIAIKDI